MFTNSLVLKHPNAFFCGPNLLYTHKSISLHCYKIESTDCTAISLSPVQKHVMKNQVLTLFVVMIGSVGIIPKLAVVRGIRQIERSG